MEQRDEATEQESPTENPAAPARRPATARFIWIDLTALRAALAAYRTKEAPMNDQYANGADMAQPQGAPAAPAAPQGVTICISAKPDGTFAVYQDTDEGQEGAGDDESAEQAGAQSAPDVDSALKIAKQLLGGGGQGAAPDDAEALFQGGFAGARGQLNKG